MSLLKGYLSGPWNNATSKNILIEKLRYDLHECIFNVDFPNFYII